MAVFIIFLSNPAFCSSDTAWPKVFMPIPRKYAFTAYSDACWALKHAQLKKPEKAIEAAESIIEEVKLKWKSLKEG